jgi:azurin
MQMKNWILALAASCIALPAFAEEKKIEITGNDQMQFNTKALEVAPGDTVVLTLKHTGTLPKAAMGHNVVILKADVKIPEFAVKAMKATTTDYVPTDDESKKQMIAHTKLIGGGESDTVTFTAPKEPGAYPYFCSFPGHYALMQGVLTVKAK